jgi:hypothetical protein
MRAIFISYRRDDAEGQAGRLFEDLEERFGKASVFMDVTGIEPGRDFRKVIEQQVASCGVLLAIIGKDWLTATDADGHRRLDDPADFVRLETAAALRRDIPVIPVLVRGAKMPRAEQLPEVLADLSFRNSVELSHARWSSDVQLLINALLPYVDVAPEVARTDAGSAEPAVAGQAVASQLSTAAAGADASTQLAEQAMRRAAPAASGSGSVARTDGRGKRPGNGPLGVVGRRRARRGGRRRPRLPGLGSIGTGTERRPAFGADAAARRQCGCRCERAGVGADRGGGGSRPPLRRSWWPRPRQRRRRRRRQRARR